MTTNIDITDSQTTPLIDSHRPLVLKGGHVGCALTHQDGLADVLIENGVILEVSPEIHISGALEVDVSNHWVLPGIIDSHCHLGSTFGSVWGARMSLRSGVTLGIDMAGPLDDIKSHAHLGGGYQVAVMTALESEALDPYKTMEKSLKEGAWGMKNLGGHYPLSIERGYELIDAGVRYGGAVAWHAGSTTAGSNILGMLEAARVAQGMPLHMAHINAYCRGRVYDAREEVAIALACLEQNPNLYSESYLCPGNATMLDTLPDGRLEDAVTAMCVEKFGFEPNAHGLENAIRAGICTVFTIDGEQTEAVSPENGLKAFLAQNPKGHKLLGSFPVNEPAIQRDLVTAKRPDQTFYVDAISTDGGCIPRNDLVTRGLSLVEAGYLTLQEFVMKSSLTPARHLRLLNRGHLSTNAIADITIVDKRNKKARATLVQGQFTLYNGKVLGEGLTFVTTERGDAHLRQAGFRTIVTDPSSPHPLRLSI